MIRKTRDSLYTFMIKLGLISPEVVVLMDGGICSQMHQYILAHIFMNKGFKVCFDLSFFSEWGSDLNNMFVRNFELLKAFPSLDLVEVGKLTLKVYKRKFYFSGNNTGYRKDDYSFLNLTPPVYLGGYYHLPPDLWLKEFHDLFKMDLSVLDSQNRIIADDISGNRNSVGVHVRRGDLVSNEVFPYGKPASFDYFKKSVEYIRSVVPEASFYFFSDEPDWVRDILFPELGNPDSFRLVDINGSDKGYMDLFLMACCRHQITSKGTMGKYAAILNGNKDKLVTLVDDKTEQPWLPLLNNPILL